jgi:GNAT superfamily N-acetyltransferase
MENPIEVLVYDHKYFDNLAELGFGFLKLHHHQRTEDLDVFKKMWLPYIEEIKDLDNHLIAVALHIETDRLIGYAIAQQGSANSTLLGNADSIILNEIFVTEEYRREKVGKTLLKNIEAWGINKQKKCLILKVRASNQSAIDFYQNMDFYLYNYIFKKDLTNVP